MLRDLLMSLAETDTFRARWTNRIHDEWMRNLAEDLAGQDAALIQEVERRLQRTRDLMNNAVPDCLVTGYERIIDSLRLPDPNDQHVLAAAITGRADVIVTLNLRDFPAQALAPFNIEAQHPDVFITHVMHLDEGTALSAVRKLRARLEKPAMTVEEYLDALAGSGLPQTIAFLRQHSNSI